MPLRFQPRKTPPDSYGFRQADEIQAASDHQMAIAVQLLAAVTVKEGVAPPVGPAALLGHDGTGASADDLGESSFHHTLTSVFMEQA